MANVKTAVSIQKALFEQVEALAKKMNISRSRLYALALEEYVRRQDNRQLLDRINIAYEDAPDANEQKRLSLMRRRHRKQVEGEW